MKNVTMLFLLGVISLSVWGKESFCSSSIVTKNCFIDSHEIIIMFQYKLPENNQRFALSYNNTFNIGVRFETKKYDTGNGIVTTHEPKFDLGFNGDFTSGYITGWKISLNSTTMRKIQDRNLPHDRFMREMMKNLDSQYSQNISLKARMLLLEARFYF